MGLCSVVLHSAKSCLLHQAGRSANGAQPEGTRDRVEPCPQVTRWLGGSAQNRAPLSPQPPNRTAPQLLCDTPFVWAPCFLCRGGRIKHNLAKSFNTKKKKTPRLAV